MKILAPQITRVGTVILFLLLGGTISLYAQDPVTVEDDPIKLFERGQDAHARNDYKTAIEFYDAAIRLKPEFPEAEFQRALALLVTNQPREAIAGFQRAAQLRPDWQFAFSRFGSQLAFTGAFDKEAEPILRRALALDEKDLHATVALAVLRQHAGDLNEAVKLMRIATSLPDATHETWRRRAYVEHAAGDNRAAVASITRALEFHSDVSVAYHQDRARFLLELNDRAGALADLDALKFTVSPNTHVRAVIDMAQLYARAGKPDESLRLLDALSEADKKLPEVIALRTEIAGDAGSSVEARAALEQLLAQNPRDATLLARLGAAYRRVDPVKSQGYYYRALQIDPDNAKYAVGYAAALVQARRFSEAVTVLQKVITRTPDDYPAHANLALALFELKDFRSAITEYEWIAGQRPELAPTYFFLAVAHDNLQEYQEALDAYEKFLARADTTANKLEIDKVNLRLPVLRDQIKRGQGKRRPS